MMKTVMLVAVATAVWCGTVSAGWTFDTNNPDSANSITLYGDTVGNGLGPAVGDTATYSFEQDWEGNGTYKLRNKHTVTVVDGPMGMKFWSQTLSPIHDDPDSLLFDAWPMSRPNPDPMPGRKPDYRARLKSPNDDISKLNITVTG